MKAPSRLVRTTSAHWASLIRTSSPSAVTEEARFQDDLDADSLDLVELVMALEERFDITVPESELEGLETVGQALDLVLDKVGAAA